VTKGLSGERYILAGEDCTVADLSSEMARLSHTKAPAKAPPWVLKIFGRTSVMIAAITGKEPDVTPEVAAISSDTGTTFRSDKAIRELGYQIRPMTLTVKDNYDWLVKEGLLAESG
jgi:hypothetical protein